MPTETRRQQGTSHPPISYPLERTETDRNEKLSAAGHQLYRPVSPPRTPPKNSKPSVMVTKSLAFLSRNSGHARDASLSQPAPKNTRISEPKFSNALDLVTGPRTGPLGSGATIVRTPYDALGKTYGVYADADATPVMDISKDSGRKEELASTDNEGTLVRDRCISRALPPLPLHFGHRYGAHSVDGNASQRVAAQARALPQTRAARPTRPPPVPPVEESSSLPSSPGSSTLRPSLKSESMESFPPVPTVPAHLASVPPQPAFEPILVTPVPGTAIDPTKVIVALESSTATHRTAFSTLVSRPSHLASWLKEAFKKSQMEEHGDYEDDSESTFSSRASDASAFHSIFHNHLHSQGLLSPTSSSMHVFLDRPSAPYAHILSYLRSPTSAQPVLPRAVQLTSTSSSRLEALYELRDEAVYLGLDELARLCSEELATRCRARTISHSSHTHTHSQSSIRTAGRRGSNASIAPSIRPMPLSAPAETAEETSPVVGDAASDASSGTIGSVADDCRESPVTVHSAPGQSRARSASHGSFMALYNHSPITATHPTRPAATIPGAPKSAPDVTALLQARVANGIGSAGMLPSLSVDSHLPLPSSPSVFTPGLKERFAQPRTRTEAGKYNSVKTRPSAGWI